MADFKIENQFAHVVQQADSIANNASLIGVDDVRETIGRLAGHVEALVAAGHLDVRTGAEIGSAIGEAAVATNRNGMTEALHRSGRIAAGITVLGGVAESISHIVGLLSGGA
jgi:hypothetical protein